MKILQTYYTSCRVGQSGASGFQFYSFSDGLSNDELFEIEKLGNYIAPFNLPSNPTEQEIEALFPISFAYFKLKSGRVGVLQSTALAQDYSGRPGNFISHAFILDSGYFPFLPIKLYKSKSFRTNLTKDEWNITEVPTKLQVLDINELELNQDINLNTVQEFLSENENEKIFTTIINSIIENSISKRKIILSDNQPNVVQWLSSISFSLPLFLANTITFSTYSVDPGNNNFFICSTSIEGSRFNFTNDSAYQFQYYVFNCNDKRYSLVSHSSVFSEVAITALTISYDRFLKLLDFFNNFNYPVINKDIDLIVKLFSASESKTNFQVDWTDLLGFIYQNAKDDYLNNFISSNKVFLEHVLATIHDQNTQLAQFFTQLLSLFSRTKNQNDFTAIFDLYNSWLLSAVFCEESESANIEYIKKVHLANELILRQFARSSSILEKNYFTEENFRNFNTYISDTQIRSIYFTYLSTVLQTIQILKYSIEKLFEIQYFIETVKNYARLNDPNKCDYLILCGINDNTLYCKTLEKLSIFIRPEEILRIVEKSDSKIILPYELLNSFKKTRNSQLLIVLLPYFFNNLPDKTSLFWDIITYANSQNVASQQIEYIIDSYLKIGHLPRIEIYKLIKLADQFTCPRLLQVLIEESESTIFFDKIMKEDLLPATEIGLIKQKYNISTKTNVTELITLLNDLKNNKLTGVLPAFKRLNSDLNELTEDVFKSFTTAFFEYLIPLIGHEKDFYYIFLLFSKIQYANTLSILQDELIHYHRNTKDLNPVFCLIDFNFGIEKYQFDDDHLWKIKCNKFTIDVLSSLESSALDKLNINYEKKKSEEANKWKSLLSLVSDLRMKNNSNTYNKFLGSIFKKH
jgi:hypothetical protein